MLEWLIGPIDPGSFDPSDVLFDNPPKRWKIAFGGRSRVPQPSSALLSPSVPMNISSVRDLELDWPAGVARVQWSQSRTDTTGMTRPAPDPEEREFLMRTGQLGPFVESAVVVPRGVMRASP